MTDDADERLLAKMIEIMTQMSEGENGCDVARTRVAALSNYV